MSDLLDPGTDAPDDESADADELPVEAGWTTAKVVGLVAVAVFMAVLVALAAQSRFDGEAADSVDVGFMQDMISHHEQAIQMGLLGVENVGDEGVRHFAQETIVAQQWEIGYMTALLEDWGFGTGDADRDTMAWMDMPTPVANMPGMATEDELDAFARMSGAEADAEFLRLMTAHHQGGVHMAEAAAATANDERVIALATRMEAKQRREVEEYRRQAEAMGIDLLER